MKNPIIYALTVLCLFLSTTLLMISCRMNCNVLSALFIVLNLALCGAIYVQIKNQNK